MYELVVIYPIIHDRYIKKSLEKLRKYTDPANYRVIVVDGGLDSCYEEIKDLVDMYIKMPNRGFAKNANEGIIHAMRWGAPYICVANDDTEAMPGWFEGIKEQFKTDDKILAVCPESPRVPLWGYGRPHEEYIDIVEYKDEYTNEDMEYLRKGDYDNLTERFPLEPLGLAIGADNKPDWGGKIYIPVERREGQPNQGKPVFPLQKRGVIDAIAMWMPVFRRESFEIVGYFDERFVWGGGEDYDLNGRAYAKGYRMVSTMMAWCWHWWGKSKDVKVTLDPKLFTGEEAWNDLSYLWPPEESMGFHMDPWGHYKHPGTGERTPYYRIPEVAVKPL